MKKPRSVYRAGLLASWALTAGLPFRGLAYRTDVVRKSFLTEKDLREAVYAALVRSLEKCGFVRTTPFDLAFDTDYALSDIDSNRTHYSEPRNECIAKALNWAGYVERSGNGTESIVERCQAYNLRTPEFLPGKVDFRAIIWRKATSSHETSGEPLSGPKSGPKSVEERILSSLAVTLRARVEFSDLSFEDKLWTCYLHACIKFIQGEHMTNASLRNRFALEDHSAASVSRIIKSCVAANFVKALDPTAAPKYMKYVPYWA